MKKQTPPLEVLIWSIALPGFGQLLNGKFLKGIVLIALEFLINMGARLNVIIILSFLGKNEAAVSEVDYQWLMFYPCVYVFSMWDAFKDAGGGQSKYATLPFVFCAFLATVGIIYSSSLRLFGTFLGPIWLPLLFAPVGILIGLLLQYLLVRGSRRPSA
jgi:TM2 domain-containing membrane protein YozV